MKLLFFTAALAVSLGTIAEAATVRIDDFASGGGVIISSGTASRTIDAPRALGGSHQIRAEVGFSGSCSGFGLGALGRGSIETGVDPLNGIAFFESVCQVQGTGAIQWGSNAAPLNADLSDGGTNDALEVVVLDTNSFASGSIAINGVTSFLSIDEPNTVSRIGFSAFPGVDWTDVDTIRLAVGFEFFRVTLREFRAVDTSPPPLTPAPPPSPVPLPASIGLLAAGLGTLRFVKRNRRTQQA